jgi:hypothetical protein
MKIRQETDEDVWCDFSVHCGHLTARPVGEEDWKAIEPESMQEWANYIKERDE